MAWNKTRMDSNLLRIHVFLQVVFACACSPRVPQLWNKLQLLPFLFVTYIIKTLLFNRYKSGHDCWWHGGCKAREGAAIRTRGGSGDTWPAVGAGGSGAAASAATGHCQVRYGAKWLSRGIVVGLGQQLVTFRIS